MKRGPCPIGDTPHNGTWREKIQDYRCMQHAQGLRHTLKAKGGSRFPKRRNPKFQVWVRQHGCIVCGSRPVDCCHVKTKGSGGDDVGNCVPLCRTHHIEQEGRTKEFNRRHATDIARVALGFGTRWIEKEGAA